MQNFGYPCYEGGIDANGNPYARIRPVSDQQDLKICEDLYRAGNRTVAPYWGYDHELPVVPGENCTKDSQGSPAGSLLTGVSFYPAAGNFPAAYRGALFFTDRLRDCIYALLPGADGLPQRGNVVLFAAGAMRSVDIEVLPGGDMLYVDQEHNVVQRIAYTGSGCEPPSDGGRRGEHHVRRGAADRCVRRERIERPGRWDVLTYEWDLDGDGAFDDSTAVKPTHTYTTAGTYNVQLRVKDGHGGSATASRSPQRCHSGAGTTEIIARGRRARGEGPCVVELRDVEHTARPRRAQADHRELPALHGVGDHGPDPEREAAPEGAEQRDC